MVADHLTMTRGDKADEVPGEDLRLARLAAVTDRARRGCSNGSWLSAGCGRRSAWRGELPAGLTSFCVHGL
jgi:hypothetical protein